MLTSIVTLAFLAAAADDNHVANDTGHVVEHVAPQCPTLALVQARRHAAPYAAAVPLAIGARPTTVDFADSASHPIRVHRGDGVPPALAARVLELADTSWQQQFVDGSWPMPLPDDTGFSDDGGDARFDVYIVGLPAGTAALTVAGDDDNDADDRHAAPAFLQVDPRGSDEQLAVTIAHELQHASQFSVDLSESTMFFEATAVLAELRARPDVTEWMDAVPAFQGQPQAPLFTDAAAFAPYATTTDARYEYGAVLWALYLDDVVGLAGPGGAHDGALIRALWQASAQPDAAADNTDPNEPDWLDALPTLTGSSVADLVLDFATWRTLVGPFAVVDDGPAFALPGDAHVGARALRLDTLDGVARTTTPSVGPFALGCVMQEGTAPEATAIDVVVHAEATVDGQLLGAAWTLVQPQAFDDAGAPQQRTATRTRLPDIGSVVDTHIAVPAGATLVLALCDVSDADADAEPAHRPIVLAIGRDRLAPPDAGVPDDADAGAHDDAGTGTNDDDVPPRVGCACDTGAPPERGTSPMSMRKSIGGLGMLVGVFAFAMRAVAHLRRKRLYKKRERP